MKRRKFEVILSLMIVLGLCFAGWSAADESAKFTSVALGVKGGLYEDNLSSYLLAPQGSSDFIALDAGTIMAGLRQAVIQESFPDVHIPVDSALTREGWILQHQIKAYLLSHAHIDHVAGLVLNAPDDSAKPIIGITSTIDYLRDHLFNWQVWPNFGNEGEGFLLKKYQYQRVELGREHAVTGTEMSMVPFLLSHSNGYPSSAFLIQSGGYAVLYFGDTGPDELEKSDNMRQVWTYVAPLIREQKLRGIFLEISYPNERPDNLLFGHLTPNWMMKELHVLAELVAPQQAETALEGLKVVVTHIKPSLTRDLPPEEQIRKQLYEVNDLGVNFIIPEQGERIEF